MSYRKKLIEVALPLTAINKASAKERTIRSGHPSTLHTWWSRKPLSTSRAVLFASIIDDPSEHNQLFPTEQEQDYERERLLKFIEELVGDEKSDSEENLKKIWTEIGKATGNPPLFLDPFAGGGSIPLEAQRLGLEVHASDLNPVAVLINKAMIEIPSKFANCPPVNPDIRQTLIERNQIEWKGLRGLIEDIRYYGQWMRKEAEQRISHLYPRVTLDKEQGGGEATVIAWLWVRTVVCPNPACNTQMPLTSKWWLCKKKGKEAWAAPVIDRTVTPPAIHFTIKMGEGKPEEGTMSRQGAKCIVCGAMASIGHIRNEGQAGRLGAQLMAIAAESAKGRIYVAPNEKHKAAALQAEPIWAPEQEMPKNPRWFSPPMYGMTTYADLFTSRQLFALTTFSDLIQDTRQRVLVDAQATGMPGDDRSLHMGGYGALAYADAIATYMAFILNKLADLSNQLCAWEPVAECPRHLFGKQAIPMIWDFAEGNPLGASSGSWSVLVDNLMRSFKSPLMDFVRPKVGHASQVDATSLHGTQPMYIISTDPPYYDNIGYADISDFFYIWLRRTIGTMYPDLFRTMLVPKAQELVASPYRFNGNKSKAQEFFEAGFSQAFERMRSLQHPDYPLTVYYAFKQAEVEGESGSEDGNGKEGKMVASTGWETMLEGLIHAGFTITGTWPMHTEMKTRQTAMGTNALATSIVLVCRPRPADAFVATRREFLLALKRELPEALRKLQHGSIAPVDLAQASIGPGMSIYSRYSQVVESDGTPLRVRAALQMINQELDAALAEQEGEYDNETRWAIAWFEQYGMQEGAYGVAETLSKAKNMSVAHLENARLVTSKAGKVRLRKREELPEEWTPHGSTVWEVTQRLIYALLEGKGAQGGEGGAADILRQVLSLSESARDLAYRLYTVCERQGWAQEALAYNALIISWTQITDLAHKRPAEIQQESLFRAS